MAAMMGSMIWSAGQRDRETREIIAIHTLLKPSCGVLTLDKAALFLGMDTTELTERLIDRSILGLYVHLDLYVPMFQFDGQHHIPHFHDLWDVLAQTSSNLETASFFTAETLAVGGPSIREILISGPSPDELKSIAAKAAAFRSPNW